MIFLPTTLIVANGATFKTGSLTLALSTAVPIRNDGRGGVSAEFTPEIFVEKHATRGEHSFGLLVKDGKTCRTTSWNCDLVCGSELRSIEG